MKKGVNGERGCLIYNYTKHFLYTTFALWVIDHIRKRRSYSLKFFGQGFFHKKLVGGVGGETPDIRTCSAGAGTLSLPTL